MTMPDLLSIVEAAYALDEPTQSWASRILEAADGSMGVGLPAFACMFEVRPDGTLIIDQGSAASVRQPPGHLRMIFDGLAKAPPGWLSSYLQVGPGVARCLMTSEVDPDRKLAYRGDLARNGVGDGINLACVDLDRRGLLLSLGVPARTTLLPSARADLVRIGTHILAALRLKARLATTAADRPEPHDAVLRPDGKLLHAEGDAALAGARRALQAAVRDVERARTSLRDVLPEALDLWKGLVSARWTLVDRFETDGKKYVVAQENLPPAEGLSMLTRTERSVVAYALRGLSTKEIAYALGVSPTTVRILIMRAARRLGVTNREGLLDRARATLRQPGDAREDPKKGDTTG
jgi:DNA-binding CsgD family transcriptional regulator